jgi:hypothetical protein
MPQSSNANPNHNQCNVTVVANCAKFKKDNPTEFNKRWGSLFKCYDYTTPVNCREKMALPYYQLNNYCDASTAILNKFEGPFMTKDKCMNTPNIYGKPVDRSMMNCQNVNTSSEFSKCYAWNKELYKKLETWDN